MSCFLTERSYLGISKCACLCFIANLWEQDFLLLYIHIYTHPLPAPPSDEHSRQVENWIWMMVGIAAYSLSPKKSLQMAMIAEVQAMLRHLCFWTVSSFSSVHFMWCLWSRHLFHENGDRYLGMLQPSVGLVQDNNSTSLESFDFTFWCSCQCCGHESLMFGKVYLHSYGISLKVFQGLQTKNILNQLNIFLWFWACSSLNCASWGCSNHLLNLNAPMCLGC